LPDSPWRNGNRHRCEEQADSPFGSGVKTGNSPAGNDRNLEIERENRFLRASSKVIVERLPMARKRSTETLDLGEEAGSAFGKG